MKPYIVAISFFLMSCSPGARDQGGTEHSPVESADELTMRLTGPWHFYPFNLLKPGGNFQNGTPVLLPHLWQSRDHAIGFATYRNIIALPDAFQNSELALYMPEVYSSYRIWIDEREFEGNGRVATLKEKENPEWRPKTFFFHSHQKPVEIVIQVSNFHHDKGGMGKVMLLGKKEKIMKEVSQHVFSGNILFVSLLIIAFYVFFLFIRMRFRSLLFFSLLALIWAFRSVFSNDYLALSYFPGLRWLELVCIEYITMYLSALFALLFVAELFGRYLSSLFRAVYILIAVFFIALTLFSEPIFFTQYVDLYLAYSASIALAVIYLALRAFVNDSRGAGLLMINLLTGALLFLYVILSYFNVWLFNLLVFNIGFLMLFVLAAFSISKFYQVKNTEKIN